MTRTFCVGEPPEELVEYHRLVKQALDEAIAAHPPGASGNALFRGTCELFSEHGYKTLLTKDMGETLEDGFFHGLGHGVGLEVHEDPGMGIAPAAIRSSPGTSSPSSRASTGRASAAAGSRISSSSPRTASRTSTDYPYDLTP